MSRRPKYKYSGSDERSRQETLDNTRKAITKVENYEPQQLNVKENKYENKLPKRPGMPKLPKLSGIKSKNVANVSGLKGKMKKFSPDVDYKKVYKNLPKKSPERTKASRLIAKMAVPSPAKAQGAKAKGLTIKKGKK